MTGLLPRQFFSLTTERLLLRELRLTDAPDIFAYASDPEVCRYTLWSAHRSLADTKRFIETELLRSATGREGFAWALVDRQTQRTIGTCNYVDWDVVHHRAEIGYALSRPYWGKGLMTEAVRAAISFGFHVMGLNRIQGRCTVENRASARVLEKAGMQYEGTLRQHDLVKGIYCDMKLYAIVRSDVMAAPVEAGAWEVR